jgi:hypothetical protein
MAFDFSQFSNGAGSIIQLSTDFSSPEVSPLPSTQHGQIRAGRCKLLLLVMASIGV